MSPIADMVAQMMAENIPQHIILLAIRTAETMGNSGGIPVDATAEKRRAYDRARKAAKTNSTGNSTGIPPDPTCALLSSSSSSSSSSSEEIKKKEERKVKKKEAHGTRIPPEWKPSEADFAYAVGKGLDRHSIAREAEKFRNWWTAKSGHGATKLDWSATWRNWVLSAIERGSSGRGPPPQRSNGYLDLALKLERQEIHEGDYDFEQLPPPGADG